MGIRDSYGVDPQLAEEGNWFTFADGSDWLIRKATSKKAQEAMRIARKPYAEMLRSNSLTGEELPTAIADKLNVQYAVEGLVVEWRKLRDENYQGGEKDVPYTKEQCTKYLAEMPELLLAVIRCSTGLGGYQKRAQEVDAAAKN